MMRVIPDTQKFEWILAEWHHWARTYKANQQAARDPVFRNAKSGRGWDTTEEIVEDEVKSIQLEAVDFQVGEMQDPHRSAIYILARNLCTGREVWLNPRLPQDPIERGQIIADARTNLMRRLRACGVMA